MKHLCVIGIVVMLAFAACTSKVKVVEPVETPTPELSLIDSLLWQQPDSALMCLLPYFDTCGKDTKFCVSTATEYNRHYAHLLLAELLYKNDYAQTNREELLQAVSYFDSLVRPTPPFKGAGGIKKDLNPNLVLLDARAHYINGVGYYEQDSVVPACAEYLKALEMMEEHFEEEELVGKKAKFMALTYTHLTNLFSDMYLHKQAIYFGKLSIHYFYKYKAPPQHIAWALDEIGLHFDIMQNYDSADFYYKEGVKVLTDTDGLSYRDIATHLAFLSYKKGEDIKPSLNQLYFVLSLSESKQEYASRCLTIGEIYYHEKEFDSAWHYLNYVFEQSQIIEAKKQAAEWLVEICKAQDKMCDMHKYAEFLVPFANQEENNSGLKSQLTELHKNTSKRFLSSDNIIKKRNMQHKPYWLWWDC